LPGLIVVVTAHAIGGLSMAAGLSSLSRLPSGTIDVMRKHVYIDRTLFIPRGSAPRSTFWAPIV
jgi:hypothetical protein